MVMTPCPHCGKPLRPGSRFCGNCGNAVDIPAMRPAVPSADLEISAEMVEASTAESPQTDWHACPNCGNPVRPGAKFCNNCGNEMPVELLSSPAPSVEYSAPEKPIPPVPVKMSAAESPEILPKAPPAARKKSRTAIPLVFAGIIMACVAIIVGGYIYLRDPFNLFSNGPLARITATTVLAATYSKTEAATAVAVVNLPTSTVAPTKRVDTPTPNPTDTPLPTATEVQTVVVLAEDFDGKLSDQWIVWLAPNSPYRPKIDSGPGENYLYLLADKTPGEAGITSRKPINSVPGLDIQFIGQLKENLPSHVLIFDWDPSDVERGPLSTVPGDIHLEIWRDHLVFGVPTSGAENCKPQNVGTDQHTYRIAISEDRNVGLFLDGSAEPVCKFDISGMEFGPGEITFTGIGWITKVQVTAPTE
jgi:hypothetical protein